MGYSWDAKGAQMPDPQEDEVEVTDSFRKPAPPPSPVIEDDEDEPAGGDGDATEIIQRPVKKPQIVI